MFLGILSRGFISYSDDESKGLNENCLITIGIDYYTSSPFNQWKDGPASIIHVVKTGALYTLMANQVNGGVQVLELCYPFY